MLAALCAASAAAAAQTATEGPTVTTVSSLQEALEQGTLDVDLRYRVEFVDSESFIKNAIASTLRGALTFETAPLRGFSVGVTFESITDIGAGDLHNNAGFGDSNNGITDRPVVADPGLVEVDRIFAAYRGAYGLEIRGGRFDYTLDNQRFIGTAPWRQNHRSFDAVSFAIGATDTVRARYAYLGRAHFNTGATFRLDAHLVHASRDLGFGSVSGYAYLLDWHDPSRARLSSATYGVRFTGERATRPVDLLYFAEYARQLDHGDNPQDFNLAYAHLGFGVRKSAWTLQAAWELRDGNGTSSVQTPLGTNHGKNGFADRLVVNPPEGSHDIYGRLAMDRERWSWLLDVHYFRAARGGDRLGTELDFQARYTPFDRLSVFVKAAYYQADTLLTDVTKVWAWATWSFSR